MEDGQSGAAMKWALCAGLLLLVLVEAGLNVGDSMCGEKKCQPMQYCDEHGLCDDCKRICDPKINNYQQDVCEKKCQEYLHEQRYVKKGELFGNDDINGKVARLTALVTVTLVVVVVVLLVLLVMLFLLYRYRKYQSPPNYTKSQENGASLKINIPPAPSTMAPPPVTPATTSTPLSTRPRYPKEDPTLEYAAYDNPALAPSPVLENSKETTPTATTTPISRRQESSF